MIPLHKNFDRFFARRTDRKSPGTFELTALYDRHREILRLKLLGMKSDEIAASMRIHPSTVNYTINSRIGRDQLEIMQGARDAESIDLAIRIKNFAPNCLKLLEDVIDKGVVTYEDSSTEKASPLTRVKTAQDYADRAGLGAVKRHAILTGRLTKDRIDKIKEMARSSQILAGSSV